MTATVATCKFCGEPVDPRLRSTYTLTICWDRPGKAGGADSVLRQHLDEFAHPWCVDRERSRIHPRQQALM